MARSSRDSVPATQNDRFIPTGTFVSQDDAYYVVHAVLPHLEMELLIAVHLIGDGAEQASAVLVHLLDFEAQIRDASRKEAVSLRKKEKT